LHIVTYNMGVNKKIDSIICIPTEPLGKLERAIAKHLQLSH
jgi:hypothetical protein